MIKIVDESILFFSRFLSQNSLWKLSTYRGYKGIYCRLRKECESQFSSKQGILATWPRDWNKWRV